MNEIQKISTNEEKRKLTEGKPMKGSELIGDIKILVKKGSARRFIIKNHWVEKY